MFAKIVDMNGKQAILMTIMQMPKTAPDAEAKTHKPIDKVEINI